jgi:alkylation response protein AidB-like acyl-CoA dehydrogenase
MQFALTEEQQELVRTVRALVTRRAGSLDLRAAIATDAGYDEVLWSALCEQIGAAALAVPEDYGGAGFSYLESHLVLETLGATLTPTPLFGSGVLATQALLLSDANEACARLLPSLAQGQTTAALCWADVAGRWRTDAAPVIASSRERLDGTTTLVLDAVGADTLLVIAQRGQRVVLFEVSRDAPGVSVTPTPGVDATLRFATVSFDDVPATYLGDLTDALARLYAVASIAVTALQVGAAQRALDRTVAYLKERKQFERPIGSFQSLKHRCADLLVLVETARSVSWAAAWSVDADPDAIERLASLAKSWCSDAFDQVASEMIQLHGGIAITWEHDAQLYFKRAHATSQLFGRAAEHRRTFVGR